MKAKTIKKLRKQIKEYRYFKVAQSFEPFGNFYIPFKYTSGGLKADYKTINAKDSEHAIQRYFKWYYRHNKKQSEYYYSTNFRECSSMFAKFKIIDEKGFTLYYK